MAEVSDWNTAVVEEFRANDGRVSGSFEGAPLLLLHHVGRTSGSQFVAPMMYLADDGDDALIYVFATKNGAPTNPDWYYNLTASGSGIVELGSESFPVTVTEVTGDEHDRIYAEQARRYPGFAGYEAKTKGIRTIPVLALRRS